MTLIDREASNDSEALQASRLESEKLWRRRRKLDTDAGQDFCSNA
jgi:hypothetical protein